MTVSPRKLEHPSLSKTANPDSHAPDIDDNIRIPVPILVDNFAVDLGP